MGLLNTVIKRSDATLSGGQGSSGNDERKILMNINSRIEDLKVQNMENAKFLRGISRRIENELNQMKEVEENRSIELYDDSEILESIERVEKSIQEINNEEILSAIEKVNTSLSGISNYEVLEGIDRINRSMNEISTVDVVEEVRKINDLINNINFDGILSEVSKINETMAGVNSDVLLFEIDKINKSLKAINSDSVLQEVTKANAKLDEIKIDDVITEVHRVEAIVSEINENAVLAELENVKLLINEKNSKEFYKEIDKKIDELKGIDYTDRLMELESAIRKNDEKIDELMKKVDRVATMPSMIKAVVERSGQDNLEHTEEVITDLNNKERKKTDSIKMVVNINLWISLLTVAIVIADILGII